MGVPLNHPFWWDFPYYKPSSYGGGTPMTMETPIVWKNALHVAREAVRSSHTDHCDSDQQPIRGFRVTLFDVEKP